MLCVLYMGIPTVPWISLLYVTEEMEMYALSGSLVELRLG